MPKANTDTNEWGEKLEVKPAAGGKYRKASALEDGQSMQGTLLAIRTEFVEKIGKDVTSLTLEENGEKYEMAPSGNIIDALKNGQLKIGLRYKFQKEGVTKTKAGKYKGKFGIYQAPAATATASDSANDI